jgi:hypothetical protein
MNHGGCIFLFHGSAAWLLKGITGQNQLKRFADGIAYAQFCTMNFQASVAILLISLIFFGCTNIEVRKERPDPNSIYLDYIAWGDEENGNITVKLQFRAGGPNQHSIILQAPSSVLLDSLPMELDSTKFTGPYYELITPAAEFGGMHTIVFTDNQKKDYRTQFEFPVMRFKTEPPAIIGRNDLLLELEGLKSGGNIRILLTDTSFRGRGIEKIDSIDERPILITRQDLQNLKSGPVYMELFREEDMDLKETMRAGGRFYLSYSLTRNLILRDSL